MVLVIGLTTYSATGSMIIVPLNYSSVQAAIDASWHGDTVLVEPGTYYGNINLNGMNIVLASRFLLTGNPAYIDSTILDGNQSGRVITVYYGEDSTCRISGFTIRNGNSSYESYSTFGGGVYIDNSSPIVEHCIIENNSAPAYGGGLSISGSSAAPVVRFCTIRNNTADSFGGGLFMGDCHIDAVVENSIITGNTITCYCNFSGGGGGVNLYHTGRLVNCLIANNTAPNSNSGGGGIHCDWGDYYGSQRIFVTGCTVTGNSALWAGGVGYVITGGEFSNCIIWGNTDIYNNPSEYDGNSFQYCNTSPLPGGIGNISLDPQFMNPGSGNYRLQGASPCIGAGSNALSEGAADLDGNPRISGVVDMGAYEFGSLAGTTIQVGNEPYTAWTYPINTCYDYNYSQQIYLESEINPSGTLTGFITKIRFHYSMYGGNGNEWNNWTVYLGNTTREEFISGADWVPLSELTHVFTGTLTGIAEDSWIEIQLQTPFYYAGGNLLVAVDENGSGGYCTAYWGVEYTTAPRSLLAGNYNSNPDPANPPYATSGPDYEVAQLQLFFPSSMGIVEGIVTRQPTCLEVVPGATITNGTYSAVSDSSGHFSLLSPGGVYATLTATDGNVSQVIPNVYITPNDTTTLNFCLPLYFPPPVMLEAAATGTAFNNAHLTWLPPGSVADEWIHWDNGVHGGSLGYGSMAYSFSVASRWTVADLAPYDSAYLKKIRIIVSEPTSNYTLKVWTGTNAATQVYSQPLNNLNINMWNEITLSSPILIDGSQELWFGYEVVQTEGYPVGFDGGPAVPGKGDMFNGGYGWFSTTQGWQFNFNWLIQGFVSESPSPSAPSIPLSGVSPHETLPSMPWLPGLKPSLFFPEFPTTGGSIADSRPNQNWRVKTNATPVVSASVTLTGYNIYRNDSLIASGVTDTFYDDPGLAKGRYQYEVTAQYAEGESDPAGPVNIQIYTCFPPTNVQVPNDSLTLTSALITWAPSLYSSTSDWLLEFGYTGYQQGTGITIPVSGAPAHRLNGLNPGSEYDVYIASLCAGNDTSAWVKKKFKTHNLECDPLARQENESCGDTVNNGCKLSSPLFDTISCGETICGSTWLQGQSRDVDYYVFTLTEYMDVTFTANAEFYFRMGIKAPPCPSTGFLASVYGGWWNSTSLSAQLAPGTYYFYLEPNFNGTIACDSLNRYQVSMNCSNCLTPTQLTASNITTSSATLAWNSSATLWDLEYGVLGFSIGYGERVTGVTQNPYLLGGLTPGMTYSFYVRSDCGDGEFSAWAGPHNFFVPCTTAAIPYYENFDDDWTGVPPQCWEVRGNGSPSNWYVEYSSYSGGSYQEVKFDRYNPGFYGTQYLISPIVNTFGQTELYLELTHLRELSDFSTNLEIMTTSDGGATWNSVWWDNQTGITGPETAYITISNGDVGSAQFQFAFVINGESYDVADWRIDNISLIGNVMPGNLDGWVTTCTGALPVSGATVTAGPFSTTTDTNGYYYLGSLPAGLYNVIFFKAGYDSLTSYGIEILSNWTTTESVCLDLSGPPQNLTLQNQNVQNGQTQCFDATQTITVAGSGTTFTVENGGSATFIAGQQIRFLPGTRVYSGGYLLGRIAPTGPWCSAKSVIATADPEEVPEPSAGKTGENLRLYPNPTTGIVTIQLSETDPISGDLHIRIFGLQGNEVFSKKLPYSQTARLDLSQLSQGIYFVSIQQGNSLLKSKLIKTN